MMEAASQSGLERIVKGDGPTPSASARPTVPGDHPRPRSSTIRIRQHLDEVMGRLHSKLEKINGDSGKIASRIPHKATQMACEIFKLEDLEEEANDQA